MGFKIGFEKVAVFGVPVGPALSAAASGAGKAVGSAAKGVTNVAGKGLSLGLRSAGKAVGGSTGPMGMLGIAAQGAQAIGNFRKNKALMMNALQR